MPRRGPRDSYAAYPTGDVVCGPVLELPKEAIGRDESFLSLGGDSITAITFMAAARREGICIDIKDIFRDPRPSRVAHCAIEPSGA
jgi:aryl carrier-like protein